MTILQTRFTYFRSSNWLGCRRRTACWVLSEPAATHSGTGQPSAADPEPSRLHPSQSSQAPLPLRVSQRIAAARAAETLRHACENSGPPVLLDPYAELLAGWRQEQPDQEQLLQNEGASTDAELRTALDVIATAHLDRLLLNATAVSAVNRITQGDYRQVVLLGDAMDTRPYRLPLAPGTAIFIVAPTEAHTSAAEALASDQAATIAEQLAAAAATATATSSSSGRLDSAATSDSAGGDAAVAPSAGPAGQSTAEPGRGAGPNGRAGRPRSRCLRGPRPPPGCLVRRVPLELLPGSDFSSLLPSLESAGFRADRLSVWAVQGLAGLGLGYRDVVSLLAEAAHCAAYHSLLLGELPCMSYSQAANALAECGLLGAPLAFGTPDSSYGLWRPEWTAAAEGDAPEPSSACATGPGRGPKVAQAEPGSGAAPQRWLFASQQIRLSASQIDTYEAHRAVAEETDEDYFDNFS